MRNDVLKTIKDYQMINEFDRVLLALSGGKDSVCLFHILLMLKDELKIELSCAHINHSIRGEDADRDERFCESLCKSQGIPFYSQKFDVPALAKSQKKSLELCARDVRYEYLTALSQKENFGKVATAHTASDNFETVIFNLTRGAGLKGLMGIPKKRGIFIRPLILHTSEDIITFLGQNGYDYAQDETNDDVGFSRNRIRNAVVPELLKINPKAEKAFLSQAEALCWDNEYLEEQSGKIFSSLINNEGSGIRLDRSELKKLERAMLARVLNLAGERATGRTLEFSQREKMMALILEERTRASVSIPGGLFEISYNDVFFKEEQEEIIPYEFCLTGSGGEISLPESNITVKYDYSYNNSSKKDEIFTNCFTFARLNCDIIKNVLKIRPRKPGDGYRPGPGSHFKKLKKMMIENKIPHHLRNILPVLEEEGGEILWAAPFAVSKKHEVTYETSKLLTIIVYLRS